MILLSWNFQGLGSPHAIQVLRNLISHFNPHILFFMETKLSASELYDSKIQTLFAVDVCSRRGGIALFLEV